MNKNLPAYAPLAVVILAAALAGAAIVSQSGMSDNVALIPVSSHPVASQPVPAGTIVVVSESSLNTASVAEAVTVGQAKRVNWNVSDYPSSTVNISIIRKTSENPATYQPIRVLSDIPNSGSTVWIPAASEIGNNIFVEVGCTATTKACQAHISPISYAVAK